MDHMSIKGILKPVAVSNTADEVYRRLRQAITDGDLPPGMRLVESTLARNMQVSRTPVREALQRLLIEQFVSADGSRGLIVARLSLDNVKHAYTLRAVLEGLAARLATEHSRPDLLIRLDMSLRVIEKASQDADDFDVAHSLFHDTIAEMANNPYVIQTLNGLEAFRTRMVSLDWVSHERVTASILEHRLIFEAIEQRNPDLAEERAKRHVYNTRNGLLRRLSVDTDSKAEDHHTS